MTRREPVATESNQPSAFLSVDVVARVLDFHPYSVYRLVKKGKVPGRKVGGKVLIPRHEFLEQFGLTDDDLAEVHGGASMTTPAEDLVWLKNRSARLRTLIGRLAEDLDDLNAVLDDIDDRLRTNSIDVLRL